MFVLLFGVELRDREDEGSVTAGRPFVQPRRLHGPVTHDLYTRGFGPLYACRKIQNSLKTACDERTMYRTIADICDLQNSNYFARGKTNSSYG